MVLIWYLHIAWAGQVVDHSFVAALILLSVAHVIMTVLTTLSTRVQSFQDLRPGPFMDLASVTWMGF